MGLRGTPVSVHNMRGDFCRTYRDCEVAPLPLAPSTSSLAVWDTQSHFPTGVNASLRSQSSTCTSPVQTLCCVALYL